MNAPKVKATPARPYAGKPTWHGRFFDSGQWHTVTNPAGLPIAYASPEAAIAGAWLQAPAPTEAPTEAQREAQRDADIAAADRLAECYRISKIKQEG
jgi:hypothetical protein